MIGLTGDDAVGPVRISSGILAEARRREHYEKPSAKRKRKMLAARKKATYLEQYRRPGAAAGLAQGDVIAAWDGRPIESVSTLRRALGPESVGSKAVLSLKRAGASTQATITVGERPRH